MWNIPFNITLMQGLNQFAATSVLFNHVISYIAGSSLFKGLPLIAMFWFFWFRDPNEKSNARRIFIETIVGCLLALAVARLINNIAPFQPRPLANEALSLIPLSGLPDPESNLLFDWNSFPSDHAALFFALATGIFMISRIVGCLVFLYTLIFICIPRIYLGFHYPTDIVAGAVLGIVFVYICTRGKVEKFYIGRCRKLLHIYPAAFQTVLFMITVEMIAMFGNVRSLLVAINKYLS